jgi:hypothetical protein
MHLLTIVSTYICFDDAFSKIVEKSLLPKLTITHAMAMKTHGTEPYKKDTTEYRLNTQITH